MAKSPRFNRETVAIRPTPELLLRSVGTLRSLRRVIPCRSQPKLAQRIRRPLLDQADLVILANVAVVLVRVAPVEEVVYPALGVSDAAWTCVVCAL